MRPLVLATLLGPLAATSAATLPRIDGLTIDGDLADWKSGGLVIPTLTPDAPRPPDATRSFATARLAWDAAGLLIAIEVTDTTPNEAHRTAGAYNADSVELFLAPDPAKWENFQLVISPGRDPAHPEPRAYLFDNRPDALRALPSTAEWTVRPRPSGYVVEARLPWAALGLKAAPGLAIHTRLFVNDLDDAGTRTRHAWQPSPGKGRFHSLTLADGSATPSPLDTAEAWLGVDLAADTARLNLIAPADQAGTVWTVRQGKSTLGSLPLVASGPAASATLALPAGRPGESLTLTAPDGRTLSLGDTRAANAAAAVYRANLGWRLGPNERADLAFARLDFSRHVFEGNRFPSPRFGDPARVTRLLGSMPDVRTIWLDAEGRDVDRPAKSGLYAARTEILLPGRAKPLVLENLFFRLPDGATTPPRDDETAAQQLAFDLHGADATPTQADRVAARWWHGVRRARGWANALPYKIHLPGDLDKTPRPLIVHLHGTGQESEAQAQRTLDEIVPLAGPEPIVVYPMSPEPWRGPAVAELIEDLMAKYPIDPRRVSLIGFSKGGIGAWEVALDRPDLFSAVVPIGGRMGSPADAARLRDVPVRVFNGADDPATTPEEASMMVDALRRAGCNVEFTLLPGRSHGDSQSAAYHAPGLWAWMLAQRRPAKDATP